MRQAQRIRAPSSVLRQAALIGPVALLAFALRLYHLDAQGLWADEGFTVEYAALGWRGLVQTIAAIDPHPAGYYLAVKAWLTFAGDTDFTVRYLSVWSAVLTSATLFALVRRIAGTVAGLAAALLLALNPLSIWYAQEARQYALLALMATIATLRLRIALERGSWRGWLAYAAVLTVTLHVHYFALPFAAFHFYLAWRACLWRPDRLRALTAFALAGMAFAPWWLSARALDYGGWMERVALADALRRTAWGFAVGTAIYPEYGWQLAGPTLAAAGLGLLLLAARRRSRGDALLLIGWALVPVGAAYMLGVFADRPAFHERYVSIGAPGLVGLAGIGLGRSLEAAAAWARRASLSSHGRTRLAYAPLSVLSAIVATALLLAIVTADVRVLRWQFADPHFSKEDLRGVAAYLAPRASPDDLLVGAPGRLNLYKRYAVVRMPTMETDAVWDAARAEREISTTTAGRRRVWLLPVGSDTDKVVEAWLDARGYRLDGRWFGLAPLKSWLLADDPSARTLGAAFADQIVAGRAALALERASAGYLVRVVGDWRKVGETPGLSESLRLLDQRGRVVAQVDRPLGGEINPFGGRPVGAVATIRSALRVPPDLPGGKYGVRLVVYGPAGPVGQEWTLGEVELAPIERADPALVEPAQRDGRIFGPGLRLLGDALPETSVRAGSTVPVTLHWQALAPNALALQLPPTRVGLRGSPGGAGPQPRAIEGASRAEGGLLRDDRSLRIPRDLAPGRHDVVVRLEGGRADELVLGAVEVTPPAPRPSVAAARHAAEAAFAGAGVAGYDVEGELRPGGRVRVAVHWTAADELPDDLTAFVHLVDGSGKPLAQHDGAPCDGACPTSGWAPGDVLVDEHVVQLPPSLPPGRYGIVVGLYDPRTGARLPRRGGPADQADSARLGDLDVRG